MKNTWKWVLGGGVIAVMVVAVVMANPQFQKGQFINIGKTPARPVTRPPLLPQDGNCTSQWTPILQGQVAVNGPHDGLYDFRLTAGDFINLVRAVDNGCDTKVHFKRQSLPGSDVIYCNSIGVAFGALQCYSSGIAAPGVLQGSAFNAHLEIGVNRITMDASHANGEFVMFEPPSFQSGAEPVTVDVTLFAKK